MDNSGSKQVFDDASRQRVRYGTSGKQGKKAFRGGEELECLFARMSLSFPLHVECRDRYTHDFVCVYGSAGFKERLCVSWVDARGGGGLTYWRRVAWLEFHANSCLGLVFCSSFRLCLGFRKLIGMRGISLPFPPFDINFPPRPCHGYDTNVVGRD